MDRLATLGEVLRLADSFPFDVGLFLPDEEAWSVRTRCAILDLDHCDDSEESQPFARQHGLRYALGMNEIKDIVFNAREQLGEPSGEQLLTAFLFYYDRDTFIDFESDQDS